jgi:hypothetical protein
MLLFRIIDQFYADGRICRVYLFAFLNVIEAQGFKAATG